MDDLTLEERVAYLETRVTKLSDALDHQIKINQSLIDSMATVRKLVTDISDATTNNSLSIGILSGILNERA